MYHQDEELIATIAVRNKTTKSIAIVDSIWIKPESMFISENGQLGEAPPFSEGKKLGFENHVKFLRSVAAFPILEIVHVSVRPDMLQVQPLPDEANLVKIPPFGIRRLKARITEHLLPGRYRFFAFINQSTNDSRLKNPVSAKSSYIEIVVLKGQREKKKFKPRGNR